MTVVGESFLLINPIFFSRRVGKQQLPNGMSNSNVCTRVTMNIVHLFGFVGGANYAVLASRSLSNDSYASDLIDLIGSSGLQSVAHYVLAAVSMVGAVLHVASNFCDIGLSVE